MQMQPKLHGAPEDFGLPLTPCHPSWVL